MLVIDTYALENTHLKWTIEVIKHNDKQQNDTHQQASRMLFIRKELTRFMLIRMTLGRMMYSRITFGRMILSRLIFSRVPFLLHLAEWYSAVSRMPFFTTILSKMTFNRITQQNGLNQNATTTVTLFIMLLLSRMLSLPSSISYLYQA